jgi:hypothetical protein
MTIATSKMRDYTVKPGRKNFRPITFPQVFPRCARGFEIEVILNEDCWWEGTSPLRGPWRKIGGITSAAGRNEHRACLAAWRPASIENLFLFTGYTNDKDGGFVWGQDGKGGIDVVDARAGQKVRIHGKLFREQASPLERMITATIQGPWAAMRPRWHVEYEIYPPGQSTPLRMRHPFEAPFHGLYRAVGPWFGGPDPAHQKMTMQMQMNFL